MLVIHAIVNRWNCSSLILMLIGMVDHGGPWRTMVEPGGPWWAIAAGLRQLEQRDLRLAGEEKLHLQLKVGPCGALAAVNCW